LKVAASNAQPTLALDILYCMRIQPNIIALVCQFCLQRIFKVN
jgi:hypothetical protein